jgi:hypothetical protein
VLTFSSNADVAELQMNAIIFYLTAFGYIDGEFDLTEKTFVRAHIRELVEARAAGAMPNTDVDARAEVVNKFVTHFHEVFEGIDRQIRDLFTEATADGENVEQFVYSKLKLRSYEIFQSFDESNQRALLASIDELIHADGNVHPNEAKFRQELESLLDTEVAVEIDDADVISADVDIAPAKRVAARLDNHPFFASFEQHYSADPTTIKAQAESDLAIMKRFSNALTDKRKRGQGQLTGKKNIGEVGAVAPFLDGHIFYHPITEGKKYELFVLGDLHGCYSCLKAAALQADFFAKLDAWKKDPSKPEPKLILLGDYIDRGRFSYNGVFRTVMELFLAAPDHVFPLRGNHEYYVEYRGRVYGGVKPAEAINSLYDHMPSEVFTAYMELFEQLPNVLFFGQLMFVHAGIPRDADLRAKFKDLSSLNDPDLRFQMLWSDPSSADVIPDDLQAQNARFPFGRLQFESFMNKIGARLLVRGHEKIDEGFRSVYPNSVHTLINLFSAGGIDNNDLPQESSYRSVIPMACTITAENDQFSVTPWPIDYKRFNDPERNKFFASAPEIEHKAG